MMDSTNSQDNHLTSASLQPPASRGSADGRTIRSFENFPHRDGQNGSSHSSTPSVTAGAKIPEARPLGSWDVFALIINKMIGSGIFTGPPTILMYTGNKRTAIGMWVGGFLYTLVSMTLYLEYSRKLPYTGGELVYLDALFPRPFLFAYTCYALYLVFMMTTATNSMQFARQVIIAATGSPDIRDERVMRFIAVVIVSVICLLLYFSTAESRRLNRWLAGFKLALMITVLVAAIIKAVTNSADDIVAPEGDSNAATAMLQVLFSFQGWENAIYVSGQIPDRPTLRKGFLWAVWVVGLFYVFINIAYCYAFPWDEVSSSQQYVPDLFGTNNWKARQAWAVLTALSSAGSMLSVSYTSSMVKQSIAWSNILPWSRIWRTHAPVRAEESGNLVELRALLSQNRDEDDAAASARRNRRRGTPQGGIALHWVGCVFYIAVTSAIKRPRTGGNYPDSVVGEGINLSGYLQSYAYAIGGTFVGLFFFRLKYVKEEVHSDRGWNHGELPRWLKPRPCQYLLGLIYGSASIVIIVLVFLPPYVDANGKDRVIKGWYYPAIAFGFLGLSILYYLFFFASVKSTLSRLASVKLAEREHGVDDVSNTDRRCEFCAKYDPPTPHRHTEYGYLRYFELKFDENKSRNFLYWLFGGPKNSHRPSFRFLEMIVEAPATATRGVVLLSTRAWQKIPTLRNGSRSEANT